MRLNFSEPRFDKETLEFEGVCAFGREDTKEKLSELLETVSDPLVVALDGPWGAGKSFFLKGWVGKHAARSSQHSVIYFDAFEHDFLDDPLIALTIAINSRLERSGYDEAKRRRLKNSAIAVSKIAVRVGTAVLSAGLIQNGEKILAALLDEVSDELNALWKTEVARIEAVASFRASLEALASERKLIVVVDELDRCRPDYALSLLELIKHFFSVPNVHFVLGVNLKELENSVRSRYGERSDARRYLHKFYQIKLPLDLSNGKKEHSGRVFDWFLSELKGMGRELDTSFGRSLLLLAEMSAKHDAFTIRDAKRLIVSAHFLPPFHRVGADVDIGVIVACLLFLDQVCPEIVEATGESKKDSGALVAKLERVFPGIGQNRSSDTDKRAIEVCLLAICGQQPIEGDFDSFGATNFQAFVEAYVRRVRVSF